MTDDEKLKERAVHTESYINGYEDAKADVEEYYKLALAKHKEDTDIKNIQNSLEEVAERARMLAWGSKRSIEGRAHYLAMVLGLSERFKLKELIQSAFKIGASTDDEYTENIEDKWANGDWHFDLRFDFGADITDCVYKRAIEIADIKLIRGACYDTSEYEEIFNTEDFLNNIADNALFTDWSRYGFRHVADTVNAEHYKRLMLALGFTDGICELRQRLDGDTFDKQALLQEIQSFWTLELDDWLEECNKREIMASLAIGNRDIEIKTYWNHFGE